MHIKDYHALMSGSRTFIWRTVEGDTGNYYTFTNGAGILFQQDGNSFGCKVATHEKFKVSASEQETIDNLNRLFSTRTSDPSPGHEWRF